MKRGHLALRQRAVALCTPASTRRLPDLATALDKECVALEFSMRDTGSSRHASRFTRLFCVDCQEEPHVEQTQGTLWVLLVYKVPREPPASRPMAWRKLTRLPPLLLHAAVCVLPAPPRTPDH